MKIILILTTLLVIAAAGCSLHESKIILPLTEVPSSYSSGEEKPAPPIGKWWEQFEDNKLNLLMEEAFRHNLDIVRAYERLRQSLAVMRITGSSGGPVLNIEGSGGISRRPGVSGMSTSDSYTLSAAAGYELDLWGKLKSKTRAAQLDALASEQNLKALYISISAQLADLYYLAVEQRAQLELSDQTIASFQDTLERVERRYREGLVPAIDVYQSRRNLSAARSRRPLFESTLSVTLNAISVLTGNFPDKKTGDVKDLKKAPVFPAGLPAQLLKNRPDIKAALLRLKASDERVAAAIADRFPSFNLIGSYGGSSDKIRTVLDSPNIFWNILLQIAQPVLDAGKRRAEVDRTEAVFRENLAVYHKAVLNAFREVEDAISKIRASEERIKMLDETVSASENSLRLALDRYMQGLTDYLPVLSGQLGHLTAKSDLIAARRQAVSDRIQLARALGGDWVDGVF
ncbi:MAG TPA: efflux transporter outer membrane subunit [Nitrospirae bacterium]|nr:efflux transporter outer membrane subunit [Nitrospirota bacterium]